MKVIFSLIIVFVLLVLFSQKVFGQKRYTTFDIEAPQLKVTKKIWVYLPLGYEKSSESYPVIYMHDAQNLFDAKTSYAGEWKVDETLDSLKLKVIVIGIEHGNDKRLDELTPFKHEEYSGGNADAYLDFIVSTLKPQVDLKYRTKTKAKHTTIFGSSLGGLVSFYAVLKYPKVFGNAGVFSPSFWFTKDIFDYAKKAKKSKAKLYFLCGDSESEDMVSDMERMTKILSENRSDCKHLTKEVIIKEGRHNEKMWSQQFGEAVLWLLK
ncbi:alpha/beta hydrolase [Flavobacterium sp. UBA6135]|uniref:alpha/beta hydrolase n=1 Tax=Flavobacterium sp. UBA6135 TaxID=1946553 RepID=UPI0025C3ABB2|nr:alpha/beta hydrolase-fold protein [Flavobacterium sp. UBA6135]